jgi:hypothetical protein
MRRVNVGAVRSAMTSLATKRRLETPARLIVVLAAGALAGPLLFLTVNSAQDSLQPYVDSLRTYWAIAADISFVGAVALLAGVAVMLEPIDSWQRFIHRFGAWIYVPAAVLVAIPLVSSSTNALYSSQIGVGGPSTGLVILGALGLGVGVTVLMARRVWFELCLMAALPVALLVVAVVRDLS